nr:hypothetical protein [uncultured Albidiferax sp.]
MRHIFIALMVVLLPLRGWVGDAMALDMAVQQMHAMQIVATSAGTESASGTFDADSLAAMPAECEMLVAPSERQEAPHCAACDTCKLCLPLAGWAYGVSIASNAWPPVLPLWHGASFRSATAALALKPPIS